MRSFLLLAVVATLAVSVIAQSTGAPGPAPLTATICERVTTANGLNNRVAADEVTAITTLVLKTATGTGAVGSAGVFGNVVTKPYFDGTIQYRSNPFVVSPFANQLPNQATPDYTAGGASTNMLVSHLTQFFGRDLGCKTAGFPAYSTKADGFGEFNQYQVHANMNITATVFNNFNNELLAAASNLKISADDAATVKAYLNGFARNTAQVANVICTQGDCPCATGLVQEGGACDAPTQSAATVSASIISMLMAAILALVASRR